jgi:hypothetical protein
LVRISYGARRIRLQAGLAALWISRLIEIAAGLTL